MRIVYFTQSLASCWNHGNVHFLRGLLRELAARGHAVTVYEPADGWSRSNLTTDHGQAPLARYAVQFPHLLPHLYAARPNLRAMLHGADLVMVHEWTDPELVGNIGQLRKRGGRFLLLFHDTHHRAVSDPAAIGRCDLSGYDGVLAFGHALAEVYRRAGWGESVFVFHEAADTAIFKLAATAGERRGVAWIGNWGDGERSREIVEFLLQPAHAAALPVDVWGVRYPPAALDVLTAHGAAYHGWIANTAVPAAFAAHQMTVHVPRRFYRTLLPGIPTIRVFEALACGIPLLCAPWDDSEGLFRPGEDYLVARDGYHMQQHMRAIAADRDLRRALAASGLERIHARHTCAHRADQLLAIVARLQPHFSQAV